MALSDYLLIQQFLDHALNVGVGGGQMLALLSLEDDILDTLDLSRRTGAAAL